MAEYTVITRVANGWVLKTGEDSSNSRNDRPTFVATSAEEVSSSALAWATTTGKAVKS